MAEGVAVRSAGFLPHVPNEASEANMKNENEPVSIENFNTARSASEVLVDPPYGIKVIVETMEGELIHN